MASILEELTAKLLATTAVTALVGKRIFPWNTKPHSTKYPMVEYEIDRDVPVHTMSSDTGNPKQPMLTYHIWAETYSDAHEVADAIEAALTRFRGTLTTRTVQDILASNRYDAPSGEEGTFHVVLDMEVSYL